MFLVVRLLDAVALPVLQFDVAVATVALEDQAVVDWDDQAKNIVAAIGLLAALEFPEASVEVLAVDF